MYFKTKLQFILHIYTYFASTYICFVSTIFYEGADLTQSVFYTALKDGSFAIWEWWDFRKSQCFPFNVEYYTRVPILTSLVWRGLYQGLNPGPPALETSTLPLSYPGGFVSSWKMLFWVNVLHNNNIWLEHVTVDICCAQIYIISHIADYVKYMFIPPDNLTDTI